jgi:hypothetical protein
MMTGGGTEVLRGYNDFRGPGGGDVFGDLYVHHYYDLGDNGLPKLSVRPISWRDGWPSLGDPVSGNRGAGHGPAWLTVTATGAACEQFRPQPVGDVLLTDAAGGRVLDACGSAVTFRQPRSNACQRWHFQHVADGYYRVVSRSGRALNGQWRIDGGLISRTGHVLDVRLVTP